MGSMEEKILISLLVVFHILRLEGLKWSCSLNLKVLILRGTLYVVFKAQLSTARTQYGTAITLHDSSSNMENDIGVEFRILSVFGSLNTSLGSLY